MKIRELESILAYASTEKDQEVKINVTYGDGIIERCDIKSFDTFSDGILLNIETTFGAKK